MSEFNSYEHLNTSSKLILELDIEYLAAKICEMNYGVHRLLSAIVIEREKRNMYSEYEDKLSQGIKNLLNSGLY